MESERKKGHEAFLAACGFDSCGYCVLMDWKLMFSRKRLNEII